VSALVGLDTQPNDYLRVSYSSLNVFASCARKFEFQKLFPQRPRSRDQFAADVGKALHSGYQHYLIHQNRDLALWEMMKHFPYESEFNQVRDDRNLEASVSTLEEMLDSVKMLEWELMQIKRPPTQAELLAGATEYVTVPAIEVPFEIRFKGVTLPDGRGIAFVGFMDAVMRNLSTGLVRTLDIKTHRRFLEDATAKYRFDSQQVPYGVVLEHIQGNPVDEFEVLYLDCLVDLVEPRVQLYNYMKDSVDVQEWLTNRVMQMQDIQRFMQMNYFPRTDGGCLQYNRPCYFLEMCQTRDRDSIIEWMLMGEEPEQPRYEIPWIVADIDVFAEAA
jgi:hypothetical protein